MTADARARLEAVRGRLNAALARAGRANADCMLLAVTKNRSADDVLALARAGQRDFGENRVQEAAGKIPLVDAPGLRWHLIGHLQTNKARRAARLFDAVHSVDSARLIDELDRAASGEGRTLDVYLEVNVSGEESKYGLRPYRLPETLARLAERPALRLAGLMTMAPFTDDPNSVARPVFAELRRLRDAHAPGAGLSMGMSGDFEVAAEEGATVVRVGTALFEG